MKTVITFVVDDIQIAIDIAIALTESAIRLDADGMPGCAMAALDVAKQIQKQAALNVAEQIREQVGRLD